MISPGLTAVQEGRCPGTCHLQGVEGCGGEAGAFLGGGKARHGRAHSGMQLERQLGCESTGSEGVTFASSHCDV